MATHPITFETTQFEFSHGKKPRGHGRWAFVFDRDQDELFWSTGLFSEAKASALAHARAHGFVLVEVAP